MRDAGVTKVCLVSDVLRNDVCAAMVSGVSKSLKSQGVAFQRLPISGRSVEWLIGDTGLLTVTATDEGETCTMQMVMTDPTDSSIRAARLAGVAAFMCTMLQIKHVLWDDQDVQLPAHGFLDAVLGQAANPGVGSRIFPRKVPRKTPVHAGECEIARPPKQNAETWFMGEIRSRFNKTLDETEICAMEFEERRSQSAPLRLSAWAVSLATAVIAAPLAIPVIVHNVMRGEDLRFAGQAMGVAGLYSALAYTGALPHLPGLL